MKVQKNINFTKKTLEGLKASQKGITRVYDIKEKGLGLYITATGHKSFFIKRRINSQQKIITIGRFPDMTIELARKEAQKIKLQIAVGENPLEEKEKQASEKTFGEAYQEYMEKYAKIESKPLSRKDIELRLKKILSLWIKRPLSSITKQEMRELHNQIGQENGKYQANRVLAYVRAIFNKMISWGWEGTNPIVGIEKFRETKRDRFILHDELPKFLEALEAEPNRDMRDFFLTCLYTGARKSNVLSMRWEDIDFSINEWRIPDTKNGNPVRVPLIEQVLEILNGRIHLKESSSWTFPSKDSKSGHIQEPKTAWKRILERAGLKNLRIHDLRRTCGSYQAIAGVSMAVIGKSLGHKSLQSTEIYARLSNDPVRAGLETAFSFINGEK
ncbi:MAG: site-specific integrase [Puniceicoccales bacterium]|jgi:integrase|nr:site-specific integrase [Puniceicoccales bacterium]